MAEIDADMMVDQVMMLGLVSREQLHDATADAEDGSQAAVLRMLLRKGSITSCWQIERLKKGDPSGFFFGDSKVLFHLAEGTFARVYRGEHNTTKAPLAIKVLRQRFAMSPNAVDRFHKEAEAGMKLHHPNIVQVIDQGRHENRHYMIMEYVEGMNLRDFMKLRSRIPTEQAGLLMLGMAQGLKYSQDGVTHRDIKGTNILISNQGEAKLVDFGLATMQGEETKPGVKSQRTVDYSALERTCNSPKGDPRSDIYFLGCVFYQMLTGQLPMEESESKDMLRKMLKRSFGAIKPINEHRYAPDEELGGIIEKMMKIDLKTRYQTMEHVVVELERYMAEFEAAKAGGRVKSKAEEEDEFVESIFLPREIEKMPEELPAAPPPPKPVPSKSILCVEAQTDIRDAFRKTLSAMGYKVMLVSDAEVAAERFREALADAVIFDTDGQDEESIEAFLDMHEKAHEEGHQLVALVLLGVKQQALKEKLPDGDNLIVLSKPIKMKQVQDALEKLVPIH